MSINSHDDQDNYKYNLENEQQTLKLTEFNAPITNVIKNDETIEVKAETNNLTQNFGEHMSLHKKLSSSQNINVFDQEFALSFGDKKKKFKRDYFHRKAHQSSLSIQRLKDKKPSFQENKDNFSTGTQRHQVGHSKKIKRFFKDLMEILFIGLLIGSSYTNFSYLNIVYTLTALVFLFYIYDSSETSVRTKFLLRVINYLVCIVSIILKLVIMFMFFSDKENSFIQDNKSILTDLGINFLSFDEPTTLQYTNSYFGDLVVLFLLVSVTVIPFNTEATDEDYSYTSIKNAFYLSFFLAFLAIEGLCCFNISFLTIILGVYIYLALFLWAISKIDKYFEYTTLPIVTLLSTQILFTHIFNTDSLQVKYLLNDDYKYLKWIGVIVQNDRYDVSKYFYILNLLKLERYFVSSVHYFDDSYKGKRTLQRKNRNL